MLTNLDVYLHMVSIIILLVFSIIYSLLILSASNVYAVIKIIAVLVLIASIYVGANRNTYLPFLGHCAIPPILFLEERVPQGANVSYTLTLNNVQDGTLVIYWGALSTNNKEPMPNPIQAYGDYSNTGIVKVQSNKATLFFNCPDKYTVGSVIPKTLERHIHYRLVKPNSAIISPVYTTFVKC